MTPRPAPKASSGAARADGATAESGRTPSALTKAVAGQGADDVVARLGDRNITASEVRAFLSGLGADQQAALARDPKRLSQVLRMMLAKQLVMKEAAEKKWDEQPAIAAQLARLRENAIAETYLQSVSQPPADYPDDDEIQKAYDANKTAFLVPRQFRVAQIYVAVKAGADKLTEDQARKKLADILSKLKNPKADFTAIAKEYSDLRDTDDQGGTTGWVGEMQLRPEIKTHVIGLAKNAVSEPIRLSDGWHIVKLIDTKPSSTRPLAEVRDLLVHRLRAQRAESLRQGYLARLLEQSPLAINELMLTRIFPAAGGDAPAR